ncbi:MAG: hypothetical protein ACE37F_05555 [Nannocystaceae bacterium]|nr:hypothetical protein [bacterium]
MQNQPPYSPGGPLSTGRYEFTNEENEKIALVGARATLWGYISVVTGVLALIGLVVSLVFKDELISHGLEPNYVTVFVVALVPVVLTHLVISMLYMGAGKSLQAVVHTQGNDVEHLMQSLDKLGTAFLVEFAIGMLAVVVSAGVGVQMAIDSVAAEKAEELARAEAAAAAAEASEEDEGDDEESDGDTDEGAAEDEAEAEEAEEGDGGSGGADEAQGEDAGGSGGAEAAGEDADEAAAGEAPEGEDSGGEDDETNEDAPGDEVAAEEPAAG